MPPKKIAKLDLKQQTLGKLWTNTDKTLKSDASIENHQPLINEENSSPSPSGSASDLAGLGPTPKRREFLPKWLETYSWLRYVKETDGCPDFMYCIICEEHKAKNCMVKAAQNRNFQNTTLVRHASHTDHINAIKVPELKHNFAVCLKKGASDQDKAIIILFKTLEWLIKEDLPLAKFQSLVQLFNSLNVKDLEILNKSKINYQSSESAYELLDCLAEDVRNKVREKLQKSEYVTVLTDESTDISNKKRQVIYAQVLNDDFIPETLFISNVECSDATGAGIANTVLNELAEKGIQARNIMSLGTDGASAMTGKEKGLYF